MSRDREIECGVLGVLCIEKYIASETSVYILEAYRKVLDSLKQNLEDRIVVITAENN